MNTQTAFQPGVRINHVLWGVGTVLDPALHPPVKASEFTVRFDQPTEHGQVVTVSNRLCDKIDGSFCAVPIPPTITRPR